MLGVAFFTGTSVLTRSFGESLDSAIADSLSGVDVAVRSSHSVSVAGLDVRPPVALGAADRVAALDGVEAAAPFLTGYAQVVTSEGKTLPDGALSSQGTAWIDDPHLNAFEMVQGKPPSSATEVVVDLTTFDQGHFDIGDQVRVLPLSGDDPFTIVGTMQASGSHRLGGQTLAFDLDGAQRVLQTDKASAIFVDAKPGVSTEELLRSVRDELPDDLEAVRGTVLVHEYQEAISESTATLTRMLQIFPLIALFVGAFVIYNTFAITVVQRTRQMALLRAIGADERQVLVGVLAESVVIGVTGAVLGVVVGIGLGQLLLTGLESVDGGLGLRLVLPWPQMVIGAIAGTVIAVASAYVPARRAAAIPPIAALRDTAVEERVSSRRRTAAATVLLILAVGAAVVGTFDDELPLVVAGLAVLLGTVFLLGSHTVRPLSAALAAPMVWRRGVVGELARENAARSPRRTATTAYSLAVGVALVTAATIFAATIRESVTGELERSIRADHLVVVDMPVVLLGGGLTPAVVEAVGNAPGVDAAVPIQTVNGAYDGAAVQITGSQTSDLARVADLGALAGSLPSGSGQIALGEEEAERRGLAIGDTIEIDLPQHETSLTVVGTYEETALLGAWLVDETELEVSAPSALTGRVLLASDSGSARGIRAAIAGDPTAHLETKAGFISDQGAQIDQLLVLLYGLLGMSVVVALIGIVNTMSLSIFERTRELGLLRAIGTTRRQLRQVIRYESALVAGIGTVGGLVLGLFFGWLAAHAVDQTFPDLTVPWLQVAVIGAVGVLAGVLAAVLPARRAARLDVLEAIAIGG